MMYFILGAAIFGLGILIGAALVQSTYNKILDQHKDEDGIR